MAIDHLLFLYLFLKEDDTMAKTKYTRDGQGYFQTKVWDGTYTPSGQKHRVTLRTKKSSRHLESLVQEAAERVRRQGHVPPSDMTLREYAGHWLATYKSNVELNTRAMYQNIISKHLQPIGGTRIPEVTRPDVMLCINNADGHTRTQEQILLTLKQVIKSATRDRLTAPGQYDDIFDGIKIKKKTGTKKRALTEAEKLAVFDDSTGFTDMEKAFVYILYGCGLRRGEAFALTKDDFDFGRNILTVNKAVAYDGQTAYLKTTKSAQGIRRVPLPSAIVPFLKSYTESLPAPELFLSPGGSLLTRSQSYSIGLSIARKMHSPDLTPHLFRHNYCTNLCYQVPTISVKKIAELLGDRDDMVVKIYNHILEEKEDAKTAINNALFSNGM